MADEEQPDWLNLPLDLLELIGQRTRDAVTGVSAFRSVCRTWRAAIGPAPRLLLPRAGAGHALVFPLLRGWSIVVDARDASCRLSHLATGATAALPRLNVVFGGGSGATRLRYVQHTNRVPAIANDLEFTDLFRFAVHAPPDAPAAVAGMTVMMYHMVEKPTPLGYGFFDFAYHDGKMFGLDTNGEMAVYDAATLDVLHPVRKPPDTPNLGNRMYGFGTRRSKDFNYVHLVAWPSKLVLVRTSVKSSRPVAFSIFELGYTPDGLAWFKVTDAGNYELFLDGYHTTFRKNGANSGTRIYYVHDEHCPQVSSTIAAYCYSTQDNRLECVYSTPEDRPECSTKPSWFVPYLV
ncbi:hypothetical protein C2845_PM16G11910 [Panicum miliaceum]|uniref:KIB1-4 beta-propeller domain-containing protein n=1 Tax=Panicum miliaceum TaxID=4540 RepID=A0A3L6PX68_PANMI|nr:hypothetical protein C2845_PM16G11910 [Panicum miliaceum]